MGDIVSLDGLETWLRDTLRPQISNADKSILKVKTETERQIISLKEVAADLLKKSEKDSLEKRDDRAAYKAARSVSRMCLELQNLLTATVLGDTQDHESLKQLSDTTAKLAGDAARIRDRWIGHVRPYYILDTMSLNGSIDKLRRLGDQTWEIFGKEGALLRRLEEMHSRIEKIEELEESLRKQTVEYEQAVEDAEEVGPQISDAERLIESLAANPKVAELRKIDNRLRELRGELLTSGFRRLGRPLRKLEAMAGRGEYPLSPEVREGLSQYLKRPFTTFIHEEEGYPSLKSVLRSMGQAVEREKLLLKQREERKVLERIAYVAEKNGLDRIYHEATSLLTERRKYLQDPECLELVRAYRQKRQELKNLESKKADLEQRSKLLSGKVGALRSSLTQFKKETELLAEKLTKRPVTIELDQVGVQV